MLLASQTSTPPCAYQEFEAEVLCLYHTTTLSVGSCIVLHASSIRQTVKIMSILKIDGPERRRSVSSPPMDDAKPVMRMGDRARVRLRFMANMEYITPGTKLIAREGKTKLVGVVRSVGNQGFATMVQQSHDEVHNAGAWHEAGNKSTHLPTQLSGAA